jgi:5'-nucleotidase
MKFLNQIFPFEDTIMKISMTGNTIIEALENGVGEWPSFEGRFPIVSGIRF